MSEHHPLSRVSFELEEMTAIELFALQCLHQERMRRSMEVLEDIAVELTNRGEA